MSSMNQNRRNKTMMTTFYLCTNCAQRFSCRPVSLL
ncbi:hypothetical protein [Acinetobacter bereziniae]